MEFDAFHFLRPWWLLALPPLAYLVWLWIARTRQESGWQGAVDANLLEVLLDDAQPANHRGLRLGMLATAVAVILAMAGPTWERLPQPVEEKNDALIILLDLSLSMLAEDTSPSRIERARQKVTDILRQRKEGLTALIAYAGDAHAVVPLTDDVATITNLLGSLGPEMMPVRGSNPDHALILAQELFDNSLLQQGRIVMLTDGIDSINSVSRHRNPAFPISIIGIGTAEGGPIPLDRLRQPGKVLLTQEGNRVIALLDHQRMQDVADLTYGTYAPAEIGDADIIKALSTVLPDDDDTLEVEREFDTWYDHGHWLAVLCLPMFAWFFRKGVILGLAGLVISLTLPQPAYALEFPNLADAWQSLWLNEDQRGYQALRHGEPEKAVTLFSDPKWQAAARYRSGDYPGAFQGFAADGSPTGKYNQANTLARLGQYQPAIDLYADVLATDPDHEDAAFNKALLEKLLQQQQEAEQQQNQDQQSQANNSNEQEQNQQQQDNADQQQQPEDAQDQQETADNQQQEQNQQGQEQQAQVEQTESTRDEQQEALEQWLRRVPDDPGGLLRRKFSHETRQRMRRGEYENRQNEKIW